MNSESSALTSLENKSILELKDLIARQDSILRNTSFVEKLKDKGAKLRSTRDKLEVALKAAETRPVKSAKRVARSDELEWAITSMKNLKLVPNTKVLLNTNDSEPIQLNQNHEMPAIAVTNNQTFPNYDSSTLGLENMEIEHDAPLGTSKSINLEVRRNFKSYEGTAGAGLGSSNTSSSIDTKRHREFRLAKQQKWDEALQPPKKSTPLNQMSLEESLAELHTQYLKQKELFETTKKFTGPNYSNPGSSENFSVLSRLVPDLDEEEDIEDFVAEFENITEESENEMN